MRREGKGKKDPLHEPNLCEADIQELQSESRILVNQNGQDFKVAQL
jgi:hypothetical protein